MEGPNFTIRTYGGEAAFNTGFDKFGRNRLTNDQKGH
jgi:hypothetical protein